MHEKNDTNMKKIHKLIVISWHLFQTRSVSTVFSFPSTWRFAISCKFFQTFFFLDIVPSNNISVFHFKLVLYFTFQNAPYLQSKDMGACILRKSVKNYEVGNIPYVEDIISLLWISWGLQNARKAVQQI